MEILIHSFITVKLDYCNSLFYGLPEYLIYRLQSIQNAAARFITFTKKRDNTTPILKQLHCGLPVDLRIKFKILVFAFNCFNSLAPVYPSDLISHYEPTRELRSSSSNNLVVPRFNLT